jgi:hypothetical protein
VRRWALVGALAVALMAAGMLFSSEPPASAATASDALGTSRTADTAHAVDASHWDPGNIISDAVFYDTTSMSEADIQNFLNSKEPRCSAGYTCLKNYLTPTSAKPSVVNRCNGYPATGGQYAATIIYYVAQSCGINPQVLLVTLEKEEGLVTSPSPGAGAYKIAMGYACPDSGSCDANYFGFFNQVYQAAYQFKVYKALPNSFNYVAGRNNTVLESPNCTSTQTFYIQNQATAGLYDYTPYVPNAAALANLYGGGGDCSSFGNRNFWVDFNDWFGSSTSDVHAPFGYADIIAGGYGTVRVAGWIIDPDVADPVQYHVYVDNVFATNSIANGPRADVGAAYPADGPNHGYDLTFPVATGTHSVCVYAINIGRGYTNTPIRCDTVTVIEPSPVGALTSITAGPGAITANGWAIDQETTGPIQVHAYVDGQFATVVTANATSDQIPAALASFGAAHGYSVTVPVLGSGSHTLCTYGINVGNGGNSNLGCRTFTAMSGNPIGSLDTVAPSGTQVLVGGWTLDPDTSGPIAAHVYVDGQFNSVMTANGARSDIASIYPQYGAAHGFTQLINVPGGTHQVCVYGINAGAGANSLIGCRNVTVKSGSPFGSVDTAQGVAGGVYVGGWVMDYDTTNPLDVHVYIDGAFGGVLSSTIARDDVAAVYPGYGNVHGFAGTIPASPGAHQVCVYGINVGPGSNALIRCSAAQVP